MSQWVELTFIELPAIELLQKIGYTYISPKKLENERDRLQEPVVISRLKSAIKRINPCTEAIAVDQKTIDLFVVRSKEFERAMDVVLPDPIANKYKGDYIFTVKLQENLKNTGRNGISTDLSAIARKIKELIDEFVRTSGIELIVQPVSILSPEFDKHLEMIGKPSKARALIMEHAMNKEISEKRRDNPEFYDSLSQRLEKIIQEFKQMRLTDAEFIEGKNMKELNKQKELEISIKDDKNKLDNTNLSESNNSKIELLNKNKDDIVVLQNPSYQDTILELNNNEENSLLKELIKSVNFHITKNCNYKCKICFAHFNQVNDHLDFEEAKRLITILANAGTIKITFVGGEPTLVRYLPELIVHSKKLGLTTMLVTNGSKLNEKYIQDLKNSLDWVGLSIDSATEEGNKLLGRGVGNHLSQTYKNVELLNKYGIKIKINTVICKINKDENMTDMITKIKPQRWKVFQILPINGENDEANDLMISEDDFHKFIQNHKHLNPIAENNDAMTDSYLMIDPFGQFFNNSNGKLNHGKSILKVGVKEAFRWTNFDKYKFQNRKGEYDW